MPTCSRPSRPARSTPSWPRWTSNRSASWSSPRARSSGHEIEDYGYRLFRAWGLGDKQRNDGALLIIAPTEHKVRIEVGYGLEGILTDALSAIIIQREIVPRFKAGDYAGGINAATDQLIAQLKLPEDEARKVAAQAAAQQKRPVSPISTRHGRLPGDLPRLLRAALPACDARGRAPLWRGRA
jgi:uncharacterized membrane protein YgcG